MDRFDMMKSRLKDLVKNHHSVDALGKDLDAMKKMHPEAKNIGLRHEAYDDRSHDSNVIQMTKWGLPR